MNSIDTGRALASSANYKVLHDYEIVSIQQGDRSWEVGEFYGDPYAALITWDEQWAIVAGEGILLVHLPQLPHLPHRTLRLDTAQSLQGVFKGVAELSTPPCLSRVFMGGPGPIGWKATWFEAVYQVNQHLVRLVADPYDDEAGIYQVDFSTFDLTRIYPPDDL